MPALQRRSRVLPGLALVCWLVFHKKSRKSIKYGFSTL